MSLPCPISSPSRLLKIPYLSSLSHATKFSLPILHIAILRGKLALLSLDAHILTDEKQSRQECSLTLITGSWTLDKYCMSHSGESEQERWGVEVQPWLGPVSPAAHRVPPTSLQAVASPTSHGTYAALYISTAFAPLTSL